MVYRIDREPLPIYPVGSTSYIPETFPWIHDESLILDFMENRSYANDIIGNIDTVVTTTRATTGTYFDSLGVMRTAANNVWRRDHNPVTRADIGVMVEEQRTNLLTRSSEFDNAAWTKNASTVTANATLAPDGTNSAEKVIENSAKDAHGVQLSVAASNSSPITCSFFVKAAERSKIAVALTEGSPFTRSSIVVADLAAGTIGTPVNAGGASASSAVIAAVGGGWYRVSLTTTLGGAATSVFAQFRLADNSGAIFYLGNGSSGAFLWGAQLEAGTFPSSYIPTVAAQVTRVADILSAAIGPWFNQAEGTLVIEAARPIIGRAGYPGPGSLSGAGSGNWIGFSQDAYALGTKRISALVRTAGVDSFGVNWASPLTDGEIAKMAIAYKPTNTNAAYKGVLASGGTPTSNPPTITELKIGSAGGGFWNGHVRNITYYPRRLTNAELQALTS